MACWSALNTWQRSRRLLPAALVLLLSGFLGQPAPAQMFEVPEGFVAEMGVDDPSALDRQPLWILRPIDGPFAELSQITLGRVVGPVDDPDTWLRNRVTADVSGATDAIEGILKSPDSPFADPMFDRLREMFPELLGSLETLTRLPLSFCDEPREVFNAEGPLRELYCTFSVGPMRLYIVRRLQETHGTWYYTDIRSMNERRLRHLIAIANSFTVDGVGRRL